ncbi:D-alanyl-D-alanine carboxypeptidase/D-alanyl-D-alanine-endopeptidase [Streptomyces sp. NPDC048639]|uniref:D-alanyl-D-alanine carboxypeptidase/D-alanyl-D-alanine endopeptidase n=1 Tax=Streptomyces sp. NPDC048639 TaxID=3365581 RepID=UPI00371FE4D8
MPEAKSWQFRWAVERWRALPAWQLPVVSALVGLAVAAGAVTAAGPWDSGQRTAERDRAEAASGTGGEDHGEQTGGRSGRTAGGATPPAAAVLAALGAASPARSPDPVPPPTRSGLADALSPLLKDPALGPLRTASIVDATTGKQLYGSRDGTAAVPASTIKIATAVAALDALGPDHRIATTVVEGAGDGEIVLVGGGDPTLTAREAKGPDAPASLRALADRTARALKSRGAKKITVAYDTSAYGGPEEHSIGPNPNLAPVSALMADEGRLDDSVSGPAPRTAVPAEDAAKTFAGLLRERGVKTKGDPHGTTAGRRAGTLATVRSQPLSVLVERMLTVSDNDIAEALARQTAIADGEPASFGGAEKAVAGRLKKLGLPLSGTRFADGSGLSRDDKVSAGLLAQLLVRAADTERPALRPVLTGLPVAGFSGTLRSRYADAPTGTGMVRAKTGTLTGVNTLAGTVVDADGRLLAFAFMTSDAVDAKAAQSVLDRLASTVANCGCR